MSTITEQLDEINNILQLFKRDIERHYGGRTVGKTLTGDEAVAKLAAMLAEARKDEIKGCQQHVFKLRTNVPRLHSSPPQMDEYYRNRLTALEGNTQEEPHSYGGGE